MQRKSVYTTSIEAYAAQVKPTETHTRACGDQVEINIPGHKLNLTIGTVIDTRATQVLVRTKKWTKEFCVWVNSNEVRGV